MVLFGCRRGATFACAFVLGGAPLGSGLLDHLVRCCRDLVMSRLCPFLCGADAEYMSRFNTSLKPCSSAFASSKYGCSLATLFRNSSTSLRIAPPREAEPHQLAKLEQCSTRFDVVRYGTILRTHSLSPVAHGLVRQATDFKCR